MNTFDYFLMIADFAIAVAIVIGIYNAHRRNDLSPYYYKLFWIGCLIGATWEFTFLFLGPEFLHSFKEWRNLYVGNSFLLKNSKGTSFY